MLGYLQDNGRSHYKNNHIWQWSTEIEKSWGNEWVTAVAYVGSSASNLENTVPNLNKSGSGRGCRAVQASVPVLRRFTQPEHAASARNHSAAGELGEQQLQCAAIPVEKRLSNGLTFNGAFTYQRAHAIAYGANEGGAGFGQNVVQNPRNRELDYGRSNIDQRLRFVWSNIYELPWMRHRRASRAVVRRLVAE